MYSMDKKKLYSAFTSVAIRTGGFRMAGIRIVHHFGLSKTDEMYQLFSGEYNAAWKKSKSVPDRFYKYCEWYVQAFGTEKTLRPATCETKRNDTRVRQLSELLDKAREILQVVDFDDTIGEVPEEVLRFAEYLKGE